MRMGQRLRRIGLYAACFLGAAAVTGVASYGSPNAPAATAGAASANSGAAAAATSSAASPPPGSVHVVNCPIPAQDLFGDPKPPAVPAVLTLPPQVRLPAGMTAYGTGDPAGPVWYSLAPTGLACAALGGGADGGFDVSFTPSGGQRPTLFFDVNPGGYGPNLDLACSFIPAVRLADEQFRQTDSCPPAAAGDTVVHVDTGTGAVLAAVVTARPGALDASLPSSGAPDAPSVAVFLAYEFNTATGTTYDAQEADCALPPGQGADCAAALSLFAAQSTRQFKHPNALDPIVAAISRATGMSI